MREPQERAGIRTDVRICQDDIKAGHKKFPNMADDYSSFPNGMIGPTFHQHIQYRTWASELGRAPIPAAISIGKEIRHAAAMITAPRVYLRRWIRSRPGAVRYIGGRDWGCASQKGAGVPKVQGQT